MPIVKLPWGHLYPEPDKQYLIKPESYDNTKYREKVDC